MTPGLGRWELLGVALLPALLPAPVVHLAVTLTLRASPQTLSREKERMETIKTGNSRVRIG